MQPIEFQISAERQFAAEDVQKSHQKTEHLPGGEIHSKEKEEEQKLRETRVNPSEENGTVDPDAKNESEKKPKTKHSHKAEDTAIDVEEDLDVPKDPSKGHSLDLMA